MTVAALWSVLDGSGTAVGLQDWLPSSSPPTAAATATANHHRRRPKRLAIDLSIWICEAQTSTVLRNFHADPAVFLAYQRAVALLKMGIQLIAVLEGDRRRGRGGSGSGPTSNSNGISGSRRRGNAGAFAAACRNCERMLALLGVPVVRAACEGEALCALLDQRDVVDGVLSNDGDCLLFGAITVYTDFSLENLQRGAVRRYDASNLRAVVAAAAAEDAEDGGDNDAAPTVATARITLCRDDLIAFAILCGSDIAGDGVSTMGAKKAIKFIDMCRRSDASTRTALETLRHWDAEARLHAATTAAASAPAAAAAAGAATESDHADADGNAGPAGDATKQRCCSLCLHAGDKRSHSMNGCSLCGTSAGEGCYPVSVAERYKGAVKEKVLGMTPTFASQPTIEAYRNPNGNAIPTTTTATLSVSADLTMQQPRYQEALRSALLFKGNSRSTSQEYLRQTMPKLLARLYILEKAKFTLPENRYASSSSNFSDDVPTPRKIIGQKIKTGRPTYLLEWVIGKEEENQLIFVTSEWQSIVDAKMSALVDAFRREEQKSQNEEGRRAMFGQGRGRSIGVAGSAPYTFFGGRGRDGGGGGNNRAGAKRRALVQGRQGGAGGKGGGGKRERKFFASSRAAPSDGNIMPRHDEADRPLAAGNDTQHIVRFMRKNGWREEEEDEEEEDARGGGRYQRQVGENRSSSDCSELSFDGLDDFDNVGHGDDGTETKQSGSVDDGLEASRHAHASKPVYDHQADAGVLYETPKQYRRGNLANPHSGFKEFVSEEKKENKDILETKISEAAVQEQVIDTHAAATANHRRPVLETPNIYYFGQLANPRVPSAKDPETNGDSNSEDGLDAEAGFKNPIE